MCVRERGRENATAAYPAALCVCVCVKQRKKYVALVEIITFHLQQKAAATTTTKR